MTYDIGIDSPSVSGPLYPDIDESRVKYDVIVALLNASDERVAQVEAVFKKYSQPDWDTLDIDTLTDGREYVTASGEYSVEYGFNGVDTYEVVRIDSDDTDGPSWLSDFAEDIGVEVRS